MLDSKSFNSVISDLEDKKQEFITNLGKVINLGINIVMNTEELLEEINDYNYIYQIFITDVNFNFWIKVSKGSIIYKKGVNRDASFQVKFTKDIIIKVLKREMRGTEAYMKGIIKVDGDLTQGLRFIKIIRLIIKYINNGFKKIN